MTNHPHPNYSQPTPAISHAYPAPSYVNPRMLLSSGLFGAVVGGTATLAVNLHKVQDSQMTTKEALVDSLAKGAGAGVATAVATGVVSSVGGGGILSLALMAVTATGVGYMLNSVGKSVSRKAESSSEKSS